MNLPSREVVEKAASVLGLTLLAFLYGFAAHGFGWFPASHLEQAWRQASAVAPSANPPNFVQPRVYERSGVQVADSTSMQPGYTLITTLWEDFDWGPGLKLIDSQGTVVHEWRVEPEDLFSVSQIRRGPIPLENREIQGTYLFENGNVLVNVEPVGTVRLDACGRVLWSLPAGTHHSIARADDGSFWIPGKSHEGAPETPDHPQGLPGLEHPVYQDQILRVSEDGEILRRINVLDVLWANDLERHLLLANQKGKADLTHLNDVEPLPDSIAGEYPLFEAGDLVVSLRNIHLLFVMDPETEQVKWHAFGPFIMQHDPDWIGDGWIGVFDNNRDGTAGGTMLGGSRIVALQPHTDSTRRLFTSGGASSFYTEKMGKWQELPNGNLLLTEAWAGRIVEVDAAGNIVWEWVSEPYSDSSVPWVQQGQRRELTRKQIQSWSCSGSE